PRCGGEGARGGRRYQPWVSVLEQRGCTVAYSYPALPSKPTRAHFQRLLWRAGFAGSHDQVTHYVKLGLPTAVTGCNRSTCGATTACGGSTAWCAAETSWWSG